MIKEMMIKANQTTKQPIKEMMIKANQTTKQPIKG